jgi:hypothetical protein
LYLQRLAAVAQREAAVPRARPGVPLAGFVQQVLARVAVRERLLDLARERVGK